MKYWIHLLLIVCLGFILIYWIDWWIIIPIALLSSFVFRLKFWLSALYGLLGGFILWGLVAFYIDLENGHILSSKISILFGNIGSMSLIFITAFIGGIVSGISSMAGSSLRSVLNFPKK